MYSHARKGAQGSATSAAETISRDAQRRTIGNSALRGCMAERSEQFRGHRSAPDNTEIMPKKCLGIHADRDAVGLGLRFRIPPGQTCQRVVRKFDRHFALFVLAQSR